LAADVGKGYIVSREETLEHLAVDEKGHIVKREETLRHLAARMGRGDIVSCREDQEGFAAAEETFGQQVAAVKPQDCLAGEAETPGCKAPDAKLSQY